MLTLAKSKIISIVQFNPPNARDKCLLVLCQKFGYLMGIWAVLYGIFPPKEST